MGSGFHLCFEYVIIASLGASRFGPTVPTTGMKEEIWRAQAIN
jgi:hypothetical protein